LSSEGGEPNGRLEAVRKRDGRLVPFDLAKIAAAIGKAMDAVGESDEAFALEVAGVVELALSGRGSGGGRVPTIEDIQDNVENVLVELGRTRVAKAYILYRDQRARLRDELEVQNPPGGRRSTSDPAVRVQESAGTSTWSKGRIVVALMNEAGLPRETASEVAARVERRVFDSGTRRISTGLIRELIAGELVDMGLTRALRRQAALAVPRRDFQRILRGEALTPWEHESFAEARPAGTPSELPFVSGPRSLEVSITRAVSSEVIRRYALEDVLGEGLAELHLAGDLAIEELGAAELPAWIGMPAELLLSGEVGPGSGFDLLDELADCARGASIGVVLEDPAPVLSPLLRATRPGSSTGLSAWLTALRAVAHASGRRLDLGGIGLRSRGFLARLVAEMAAEAPGPYAPRLFLSDEELGTLIGPKVGGASRERRKATGGSLVGSGLVEDAVELLLQAGRLIPVWGGDRRFAAPGCRRSSRERGVLACGGAAVINLPRLARRAGPWRESQLFEELSGLVRAALEGARAVTAFQARTKNGGQSGFARMRTSFALAPAGLAEALFLMGDGRIDPDQGARILGLFSEAARRFAKPGDPEIVVSPFFGERAAGRFAWLDGERLKARTGGDQGELFGQELFGLEGDALRPSAPYTHGYGLGAPSGWWPGEAEARLVSSMTGGALLPFPFIDAGRLKDAGGPELLGDLPLLSTWRRFSHSRDLVGATGREPGLFTLIPGGGASDEEAAPTDTPSSDGSPDEVPGAPIDA